ncbi:unnamed protein product [Blepharisma stoltei]|uniref:Uncharacterized protein n=1 Tax=Blepharisma stoltei TaxID=1481888 RepID=A0AAU9J8I6_9CILI|nr:unnamed protein product [Blepharisma stoltei]
MLIAAAKETSITNISDINDTLSPWAYIEQRDLSIQSLKLEFVMTSLSHLMNAINMLYVLWLAILTSLKLSIFQNFIALSFPQVSKISSLWEMATEEIPFLCPSNCPFLAQLSKSHTFILQSLLPEITKFLFRWKQTEFTALSW